jgi:hypothetical protein
MNLRSVDGDVTVKTPSCAVSLLSENRNRHWQSASCQAPDDSESPARPRRAARQGAWGLEPAHCGGPLRVY